MDPKVFQRFKTLIYERSGISLGDGKETLVSARIGKRMRTLGIDEPREYLQYTLEHEGDGEVIRLLDAISTNFTNFYREPVHFEKLREVAGAWASGGQRKFRVWCAASSTGEEPYTLAITLLETLEGTDSDIRILATDISTRVLEKARNGVYSAEQVKPVPAKEREKHFEKRRTEEGVRFHVRDRAKGILSFHRLNLATPPFPMQGPFDVVFCRNVMIYFDNDVRSRLLNEICRLLRPGGYLMVGHAESLAGLVGQLKMVRPSVYFKP